MLNWKCENRVQILHTYLDSYYLVEIILAPSKEPKKKKDSCMYHC